MTDARQLIDNTKRFKSWVPKDTGGTPPDLPDTIALLDDGGIDDTGNGTWTDPGTGNAWGAPDPGSKPGSSHRLNGRKVWTFDGSTQKLNKAAGVVANLPAFSIMMLVKGDPSFGGNQYNAYTEWQTGVGNQSLNLYHITADATHITGELDMQDDASAHFFLNSTEVPNDLTNGQWNLLEVVQTAKNARKVYIDGTHVGINATTLGTLTLNLSQIGSAFGGDIAFVHLRGAAHSDADRTLLKQYVAAHYGMSFS